MWCALIWQRGLVCCAMLECSWVLQLQRLQELRGTGAQGDAAHVSRGLWGVLFTQPASVQSMVH